MFVGSFQPPKFPNPRGTLLSFLLQIQTKSLSLDGTGHARASSALMLVATQRRRGVIDNFMFNYESRPIRSVSSKERSLNYSPIVIADSATMKVYSVFVNIAAIKECRTSIGL